MGHLRQQRVVIGSILIVRVVPHKDHLDLSHVVLLIHLKGAPVDHFLHSGLIGACIVFIIVNVVVDLIREFMALFKALMVSTDEYHA
jgi:hypothetical protein